MSEPRYPFVAIDVTRDDADEASAMLFELGAEGIEERDESTLRKGQDGLVTLLASFATHDEAREAIDAIDAAWSPRLEEVVGDGWRDEWKKHFHPFELCPKLVVRPPWEPYDAKEGERVLELEPGRAFGTGLHETTALVAAALHAHAGELRGRALLDVGTGSGILALVALLFSAGRAVGIDNDADAITVARENAQRNGLGGRVRFEARTLAAPFERFAVVLANIEAKTLVELAGPLTASVDAGGLLVLSGLLAPQVEGVAQAFSSFAVESTMTRGEWAALLLRAPSAC